MVISDLQWTVKIISFPGSLSFASVVVEEIAKRHERWRDFEGV